MLEGAGSGPFWCECCQQICDPQVIDEGIGSYEYWGAKGNDVRLVLVSSCCEADFRNYSYDPEEDE